MAAVSRRNSYTEEEEEEEGEARIGRFEVSCAVLGAKNYHRSSQKGV
jgi:hypothetical protein